jgi:putative transposase
MGQSLAQMYIHLIFSTKKRYPFINPECEHRLHAYMDGIFKEMESPAIIINSVPDHVHVLFRLSKNYALAKVVEMVKKDSSKWMKTIVHGDKKFTWQIGYGAFSVSSNALETVKRYIKNQKTHHEIQSLKDEFEDFIKHYEIIEYDPKYFWD